MGAKFQGNAYFWTAKFQGNAFFGGAEFQGDANFWEVKFQGETYFQHVKFKKGAVFWRTKFEGNVTFAVAEFWAVASILPKFMKREVLFVYATLENTSLTPLNLGKAAWIDFKKARLRNTQIRREDIEGHIIQEHRKNFSDAKEVYLLLKNNFHTIGRYDDESWAFRKEKEMERKSFWHFRKEYKERELGER